MRMASWRTVATGLVWMFIALSLSSRKPRSGYPGPTSPPARAAKWVPARAACGRLAGMTSGCSCRNPVQRHIKHIEIAQLVPLRNRHRAIGDHRHHLFGQPAMRTQRLGEPREIMPLAADAEHLVDGRGEHDVADPVARQFETRAGVGAAQR